MFIAVADKSDEYIIQSKIEFISSNYLIFFNWSNAMNLYTFLNGHLDKFRRLLTSESEY